MGGGGKMSWTPKEGPAIDEVQRLIYMCEMAAEPGRGPLKFIRVPEGLYDCLVAELNAMPGMIPHPRGYRPLRPSINGVTIVRGLGK